MEYCKFCGEPLEEGKCQVQHTFKKMCVNCKWCTFNEEDKSYRCLNETNMKNAEEKIRQAASQATEAYQVVDLEFTISPLPLKKPTLKCKEWVLSDEVKNGVESLFV